MLPVSRALGPSDGVIFYPMPTEPAIKRAVAFVDGQNLYHAAREAFGYTYPNYDVQKLARQVCRQHGCELVQTRFYTGVPDPRDNAAWSRFWTAKLGTMGHQGVSVYSRRLRYRNRVVRADGRAFTALVGEEKGIDVRIALDVIGLAHHGEFDVAVVLSQDQDLSEVADELRVIARERGRWLRIVSAFPNSPTSRNYRGINKTAWVPIDRAVYDQCLDQRDYRREA